MSTTQPTNQIATLQFYPLRKAFNRYFALWYFTTLITLWNILGHTKFGFEQSWMHPFVGLTSALTFQFLLEWVDARATGRTPRFAQSRADFINKVTIVLEEADESDLWLEITERSGLLPGKRLKALRAEAEELTRIFNATRTTARNHKS